MSENTIFIIKEQEDGSFTVTRHWMEEGSPELRRYRHQFETLKEATVYCDSDRAEYGYKIEWLEETPLGDLYKEAKALVMEMDDG